MSGEGAGGRGAAAAGSEREGSEGAEEAEDSAREKPEDDEAAEREELAAAKEAERHGPEGAKEAERPGTRSPTRSELKVPDSRASFSFLDAQDAYQSLPSTAPTGADRMGTRLWAGLELPEIETRTREMAVELLQPTVQRVTGLEAEFADLARDLKGISIAVDEHWRTRSLVELQNETLTAFRAEMARWDMLRMEQEGTVKTSLAAFRKEVDDLRYRCTRIDSAMETCSRGATRNNQALEELQRTTDSLRSHLTESVDGVKRVSGPLPAHTGRRGEASPTPGALGSSRKGWLGRA
ncbi:unnamed protein product [Prorocentrum cordatum]|uniref:Uncharacterized protein n=1 Tax=Prorocentrum cordatum TaxID=2364126 RepID=A0ABN9WZC1_9DINO|nr:unnamed protein product [Polarella glacialis]